MTPLRWLVLAAIVAATAAFIAFAPDESTIIRESAAWRAAVREDFAAALAIFFAIEVVAVAVSAPVGIWLSFLAGFLFGVWAGTAVVALAATAGAVIAFLAARYVFADLLRHAAHSRPRLARTLDAVDRGLAAKGAFYLLLIRLTPIFPFWMVNLAMGLTRVRLRDYWWATQLGILPMTLVVVNAGASLAEVTTLADILSLRVILAMCLLPLAAYLLHRLAKGKVEVIETAKEPDSAAR
jgi:uncharacterized membrane protein YdjX (TVP38/TMEM64 family)